MTKSMKKGCWGGKEKSDWCYYLAMDKTKADHTNMENLGKDC